MKDIFVGNASALDIADFRASAETMTLDRTDIYLKGQKTVYTGMES